MFVPPPPTVMIIITRLILAYICSHPPPHPHHTHTHIHTPAEVGILKPTVPVVCKLPYRCLHLLYRSVLCACNTIRGTLWEIWKVQASGDLPRRACGAHQSAWRKPLRLPTWKSVLFIDGWKSFLPPQTFFSWEEPQSSFRLFLLLLSGIGVFHAAGQSLQAFCFQKMDVGSSVCTVI